MTEKTIMAIGAHHDDIELRCGGTLAYFAKQNWRVVYVVAAATPNYHPSPEDIKKHKYPDIPSNEEIIAIRDAESREAAEILGASEVFFWNFRPLYWYKEGSLERVYLDGKSITSADLKFAEEKIPGREFFATAPMVPEAVDFACSFISGKKPDIILTHSADDSHWEHYTTSLLVSKAVKNMGSRAGAVKLYGWEPGGAGGLCNSFAPSRFVDITDTMEIKCAAIEVFSSQEKNSGYTAERARVRAKAYGALAGMEYAEPFADFNMPGEKSGINLFLPEAYDSGKAGKGLE